MKAISRAVRVALLLLMVSAVALIAYFSPLVASLYNEGRRSLTYSAYGVAVDRAIQLSRLGRILPGTLPVPEDAIEVPKSVLNNPASLGCDSAIVSREFDPAKVRYAVVLLDFGWTTTAYIIYSGPPPDFSPFLAGKNQRFYFSSAAVTNSEGNEEVAGGRSDFETQYRQAISGREFVWESFECSGFTYTKIVER
jgi:hypothetical protein